MYDADMSLPSRRLVHLVVVELDRCGNVYGDAPCAASGGQCYYSWASCEDKANYLRAKRSYSFVSRGGAGVSVAGALPYLAEVSPLSTEIDPERSLTVDSRMQFLFDDDVAPVPADHDKGAGKYDATRDGTFWKNLVARNPNFRGRRVRLYEGLPGYSMAEFKLKFTGALLNIEFVDDSRVRVTASDNMKRFKSVKVPNAVSSHNTLQADVTAGDLALTVADGGEFQRTRHATMWLMHSPGDGFTDDAFHTAEPGDWDFAAEYESPVVSTGMRGLAYRPDLDLFYTVNNDFGSEALYTVDRRTGAKTLIGSTGRAYYALAWDDAHGVLFATTKSALYTVDPDTGSGTLKGSHGGGFTNVRGLAWRPATGVLYGIDDAAADTLLTVNILNGAASAVGTLGLGTIHVESLACDTVTDKLYTADVTGAVIELIEVNAASGAGARIGSIATIAYGAVAIVNATLSVDDYVLIEDGDNGDEYCRLHSISGDTLSVTRGCFGTAAVDHAADVKVKQVAAFADPADTAETPVGVNPVDAMLTLLHLWAGLPYQAIDWSGFLAERDDWANGLRVRRILATPLPAERLLSQLRAVVYGDIWQREDQRLTARILHPLGPHETLTLLSDAANLIEGSAAVDLNTEAQATRMLVYFAPRDRWGASDHGSADDFSSLLVTVNADAETENNYRESWPAERLTDWIFRVREARVMASRYLRRYAEPPAQLSFAVDRKDSAMQTGQIVALTTGALRDAAGDDASLTVQVLRKREESDGLVRLKTLQTRFTKHYGFIAHSGASDYGAASDEEKRHVYIGDGDGWVGGGTVEGGVVF